MRTQFTLEAYLKDPSQKVETRDGSPVRIICTDKKGKYCVVGLVTMGDREISVLYNAQGQFFSNGEDCEDDLFFVTPELKKFRDGLTDLAREILLLPKDRDEYVTAADVLHKINEYAPKLLELARNGCIPESEAEQMLKDRDNVVYQRGKEEALKSLPKWRKDSTEGDEDAHAGVRIIGDALYWNDYYLMLSDLFMLPKEK